MIKDSHTSNVAKGAATERILKAAVLFTPTGMKFRNVLHLDPDKSLSIGPFTITPYPAPQNKLGAWRLREASIQMEGNDLTMILKRNTKAHTAGRPFRFRVLDAAAVPRGYLLGLGPLDGSPALEDVSPGRKLSLRSPDGTLRNVAIKDLANTDGGTSRNLPENDRHPDFVTSQSDASVDRV